jgi:hypothetical protein
VYLNNPCDAIYGRDVGGEGLLGVGADADSRRGDNPLMLQDLEVCHASVPCWIREEQGVALV